ncbi:uncharacterized protein LOC122069273 isoform X2 [Macadamia integrifolia]|uniref:uncharacterized protein LOC122069273 isoform X2 n=1 Tax=Macadamia integrifolia TaxID=60698 RepID=UPI001C4EA3F3|nr:uncharacterized protein LOC122069273 isoform X2 [Macadamia integrifolia]
MQSVKEKIENASARTPEEREMAHERRKDKEARANMEFHEEKAQHKADRLDAKQHAHLYVGHHQQLGKYEYLIPMPGGEYPMRSSPTARATPTSCATDSTDPIRLDAHHQHGKREYPIPTPGGEYPMGGATTKRAAPITGAMDPSTPCC